MNPRRDKLVQFISRTFLAAVVAIAVGSGVLVTLFYERGTDESWVRHSRETTRLAREVEIASLRRLSILRGHAAFGGPLTAEALGVADRRTHAQLDSLHHLTQDAPAQQARADRIDAAFARWDSILMPPALQRLDGSAMLTVDRAQISSAEVAFAPISAEVAAFLETEEHLYDGRVAAAHRLDRLFLGAVLFAVVVVLAALFLLRDRLLSQAQELQVGETRFRTLVESLHDVVFTLDRDMRHTGMFGGGVNGNPGGVSEQYIGKTAVEILGPEVGRIHVEAADRALHGESFSYDWTMDAPEGRHNYNVTVSPLRDPQGEITGVVGINRETTEQVARDKALADAREQLRQAQRLDALGQLAGGVAHDFNNLLTVIMTYAAILQEEAESGSDDARSIDEIRLASERAAELTRQLLAFGRRQMLQPRAIDLNQTVREVERMLSRLLPPDIVFETHLAPSLGLVNADPGQIQQVLINLAINARDAMPEGGRLTIETVDVDGPDEKHGMKTPHVLITVSDTGTGMKPETRAKVFEPFFTTKGVGKGTGLGLATVHGIIEQSGGRITLDSELGLGTTFFIRLPRQGQVAALASSSAPAPSSREAGGSETILLVDDNEELRRVVKRMLTRAGYAVAEASNGVSALAYLDQGGQADLVLSDVMMPEMNGRAVHDAIRQRHPDVRLLLMSGYNSDTALRGMAQRGDVAFIEKPFTAETLLGKLREVLEPAGKSGAA
jgi:signal transduction histidine kinase/ActR/RegA family two-component response regulator